MALEAVVLSQQSQQASRFGCGAMAGGPWSGLFSGMEGVAEMCGAGGWDDAAACSPPQLLKELVGDIPAAGAPPLASGASASVPAGHDDAPGLAVTATATATATAAAGRRKRRRLRPVKNEEEVESQRMIHIAVERNRRKQMNVYLAALRSLMPPAYTQRGDQASIVGGAINFVKELEQLLQSLEAWRRSRQRPAAGVDGDDAAPFADFFTFPQYSMRAAAAPENSNHREGAEAEEASGSKPSAVADVEATMVDSHANLRVLSRRRPRQLLRLVLGLQGHRLTVLHLNMSSSGHMVLYSFSLKVEDDCQLTSVDEIAAAAHQIVEKIHEEQGSSLE